MRIAVSSSSFRRPFRAGELTQLEWVERSAAVLGIDGLIAAVDDFPRRDPDYVAQLRKVAIDLGLVPFGIEAPTLLDPAAADGVSGVLALATGFGAAVIRTVLPAPGDVPPASFVEAVATAKIVSRAAKAANVTVVVSPAPGTIGEDLAGVKHLLKDVDSSWLRACPSALIDRSGFNPRERFPTFSATLADDPVAVARGARGAWLALDAPDLERPWDALGAFAGALRAG